MREEPETLRQIYERLLGRAREINGEEGVETAKKLIRERLEKV